MRPVSLDPPGEVAGGDRLRDREGPPHRFGDRAGQPDRGEHAGQADEEGRGGCSRSLPPEHIPAGVDIEADEHRPRRTAVGPGHGRGNAIRVGREAAGRPAARHAVADEFGVGLLEGQGHVGRDTSSVDSAGDDRGELPVEDLHLANVVADDFLDESPHAQTLVEAVAEGGLHADLDDPRLVDAADSGVLEHPAVLVALLGFLDHAGHVACQQAVEDVRLGLFGGVGQKPERRGRPFGVDGAHRVGAGDEELVDDRVFRHVRELLHDRFPRETGLFGDGHVGRQQPGLGDHVPSDFVLDSRRHVLDERGHPRQQVGDPVASRPSLLKDRPPGGERLHNAGYDDRGQHQQGCHGCDSGSKRHARSPWAPDSEPTCKTSAPSGPTPPARLELIGSPACSSRPLRPEPLGLAAAGPTLRSRTAAAAAPPRPRHSPRSGAAGTGARTARAATRGREPDGAPGGDRVGWRRTPCRGWAAWAGNSGQSRDAARADPQGTCPLQWPRRGSNPHGDSSPRDFKSRASASFATRPAARS